METMTRTHKLCLKNSINEFKHIGSIITDAETLAIIAPLIEAGKIRIALNAELDFNSLLNLQMVVKGKTYLNNFPAIFSVDRPANKVVAQQPTVIQNTVQQAADVAPF